MFDNIPNRKGNNGYADADARHAPKSLPKRSVLCNRDIKIKTGDNHQGNQNRHRKSPKVCARRKDEIGENQKHYGNEVG
jgi:hypothetical protein